MTATYSGDPTTTPLDKVRFLLGDTNVSAALASDEEIGAVLVDQANPYVAVVIMAEALAAKYARKMDLTVGGTSVRYSQIMDQFLRMADVYKRLAMSGPNGRGYSKLGNVKMIGGGATYLGPDDSPTTYQDDYSGT